MKKTLILYFSRPGENYFGGAIRFIDKGNTQSLCEEIQAMTGGDLCSIEMIHPYSSDYETSTKEALEDLKADARPEIESRSINPAEYEAVILAYPIYWGTFPMAVHTFLEQYDFSNKEIYPLSTHEGSGLGHSIQDLKKALPQARIHDGLAVRGSDIHHAANTVRRWLAQNQIV